MQHLQRKGQRAAGLVPAVPTAGKSPTARQNEPELKGEGVSPDRIAAQVVTGMGFLGAGVILKEQGRVVGLTTAATLWATAAVGLAVAYHMYLLAVLGALIVFG